MTPPRTIFALSGGFSGEHTDAYTHHSPENGQEYFPWDTKPVDERIVEAARKANPHLLHLVTPSEDGAHGLERLHEAFTKRFETFGCSVSVLRLRTDRQRRERIEAAFKAADVVYVSGGNTHRALKTWRRLGVESLLRRAYESGTVMSGCSAGASCWFRYVVSNSYYTGVPFIVSGMGWLNGVICPHYDSEPFRHEPLAKALQRSPRMVGLALDDCAAVEIVDETLYKVHIYGEGARARKCYWHEDQYVVEDLLPQEQHASLQDLLSPG